VDGLAVSESEDKPKTADEQKLLKDMKKEHKKIDRFLDGEGI